MTTKTIHYDTRALMKTGKDLENSNGFRAVHTDFTNNDEAQGFEVFFDDQASNPLPKTPNELRFEALEIKILDDTITQRQLVEYERLKIQLRAI